MIGSFVSFLEEGLKLLALSSDTSDAISVRRYDFLYGPPRSFKAMDGTQAYSNIN